ncbi:hypothetical protein TSC_c14390 [Thermus scotoductus SA-01]|uniref:Uncharacterized protein n=1 Tax=Thermus scotoductus (strain ATCC 700910 / SA-01) TaxID=743525 RepID=E8PK25_THESS|nr:hypothetical protein TSC_c14390 [Thermus scotoductus SA-01]
MVSGEALKGLAGSVVRVRNRVSRGGSLRLIPSTSMGSGAGVLLLSPLPQDRSLR